MIIKVEAIIREEKLQDVLDALGEMEVHGLTCYQVMGCGTQRGMKSYVRGHQEVEFHMLPKIKLEVLVSSEEWENLQIRFTYPEKYWKLANYYFSHNKAWISGKNTEKLEKVIAQKKIWGDFPENCFGKSPF